MGLRPVAGPLSLALVLVTALIPGAPAEPKVIDLAIRGGVLPGGQRVVRVQQGDDVTLRWTSDGPVTIHLHGYDIEAKRRPSTPAEMTFLARATGRFPITIHGQGKNHERTLGYGEVHPK